MKKIFLGLLLLALPIGVFAEEKSTFGLFVGQSHQDATLNDEVLSEQGLSFGIGASYTIFQKLKVELSYIHNPEVVSVYFDDESVEQSNAFRAESVDLGVKYGVNLYRKLSLYGHAGVSYWKAGVTKGFSSVSEENKKITDFSPYFSISIDYDWNKNDVIGIEYKIIDMSYESADFVFENEVRNISLLFKSKF